MSTARSSPPAPAPAEDLFGLVVSLLLFGYFGFFATNWGHERLLDGTPLPMVSVFKWTLRISAIGFGVALLLALLKRREAGLLAGTIGLLGAIAFLAVAVWGFSTGLDPGLPPFILVIFALWNGYASWGSLRGLVPARNGR